MQLIYKLFGLTLVKALSAIGALISVTAIVRFFPVEEAGRFFVFLALTQLLAGATLGPLSLLVLRFGSIHHAEGNHDAFGRLILFSKLIISLVLLAIIIVHPLMSRFLDFEFGTVWMLSSIVGLTGAVALMSAIIRVQGMVLYSTIPNEVLRPIGLAAASMVLWIASTTSFEALATTYIFVMFGTCVALLVVIPFNAMRFSIGRTENYSEYIRAYRSLIFYGLVSTLLSTSDIIIVSSVVSLEAAAPYKVAFQYAMLMTTGVMFSNLIYAPEIATACRNKETAKLQSLAKASSRLSLGFFALGFLPLLLGPQIFKVVFGPVGEEAWLLTLVLCAGRFVNAWFGSVTIIANVSGSTVLISVMQAMSVLLLIALGGHLGSAFGAIGVAIASSFAAASWVVTTSTGLRLKLSIKLGPL